MITFVEDTNINLVNLALSHKLYVPNFSLRHALRAYKFHYDANHSAQAKFDFLKRNNTEKNDKYENFKIKIIAIDEKPIGVAVFDPTDSFTLQIYIKKDYRNQGYGSQLIKELLTEIKCKEDICVGNGVKGSMEFWKKHLHEENLDPASLSWYEAKQNVEKAEIKLKSIRM